MNHASPAWFILLGVIVEDNTEKEESEILIPDVIAERFKKLDDLEERFNQWLTAQKEKPETKAETQKLPDQTAILTEIRDLLSNAVGVGQKAQKTDEKPQAEAEAEAKTIKKSTRKPFLRKKK